MSDGSKCYLFQTEAERNNDNKTITVDINHICSIHCEEFPYTSRDEMLEMYVF